MRKQLTYILGAGASFESIPLVKSFPTRFQKFNDYLIQVHSDARFGEGICNTYRDVHKKSKELYEAFKSHQSFDTYFKKLFHTKSLSEIFLAKKILNLYFIWEHLSRPTAKPIYEENDFWKQSIIDKRYDALIAGLLKPINGKAVTYCPINFITWNYNLNLFLSLKNYFGPDESIGEFLKRIEVKGVNNVWNINEEVSVLNMNGYFFSSSLSKEKNLSIPNKEIHDFMSKKINEGYLSINYTDEDAEKIKFAWESNPEESDNNECLSLAIQGIKDSEHIIVIGYTFPLYNRLIDFQYFNGALLKEKNIYLQDPNAKMLRTTVVNDFNIWDAKSNPSEILLGQSTITLIENCDSFYVPSSIFGFEAYRPEFPIMAG